MPPWPLPPGLSAERIERDGRFFWKIFTSDRPRRGMFLAESAGCEEAAAVLKWLARRRG